MVAGRRRTDGLQLVEDIAQQAKSDLVALLRRRGIRNPSVLRAMLDVPREEFVGLDLAEFAYDDAPLPIGEGQILAQPYLVALLLEALNLTATDRVLELGTGSGYGAALLSCIVSRVFSVEPHPQLAHQARTRLQRLQFDNVSVLCGDATLGWPEHGPYSAILLVTGVSQAPEGILEQLAVGGRLVMPTDSPAREQGLLRMTRVSQDKLEVETLPRVRYVPLSKSDALDTSVLDQAEVLDRLFKRRGHRTIKAQLSPVSELIERAAFHIPSIDHVNLSGLLNRIGHARVVLLGEASHGSAEFYEMRARITQALVEHKGFNFVAVEADWPDAAQVNRFVRGASPGASLEPVFTRFPTWMWANTQVLAFVKWLRDFNASHSTVRSAVGFYGLDLYSLFSSINAVIQYLRGIDQELAMIAQHRYGCLTPWQSDPATYGRLAMTDQHRSCEREVVLVLDSLLRKRVADTENTQNKDQQLFDAVSNARLIKNAEQYYRLMYRGSTTAWNLRDQHMFETLNHLLAFHGAHSKAVIWAHNSHIGNAAATEMGARNEINIGHLCQQQLGRDAYKIGFGTHLGTVAAASHWGEPMEVKVVRPSHPASYERLCHDAGLDAFLLPLRDARQPVVRALQEARLERAIGVIYRPETELASHYFNASLPNQFDEYIWFDETRAIDPLGPETGEGAPETFPFGL